MPNKPLTEKKIAELERRASVHVKAGSTPGEYVKECVLTASELVTQHIGSVTVPDAVLDRAIIEVSADLYYRRNAQNGIAQFGDGDTLDALRIGLDPLRPAKAMLQPYLRKPLA